MTPDERCAQIFNELARVGIRCLVMGGHAVRFYGIQRGTIDFDLAVEDSRWDDLPLLMARAQAIGPTVTEGASWRPGDFRRFVAGTLSDGREERVEFWRRNHLLAPFPELFRRRRNGVYGGDAIDFLGPEDLLRSKETEREDDWRDIQLLEEVADAEHLRDAGAKGWLHVLKDLRSQRGFALALQRGAFADHETVTRAIEQTQHPVTAAILLPFCKSSVHAASWSGWAGTCTDILDRHVRNVTGGSARHLALVEAVRRSWKADRMAADRADKARFARSDR